MPVLLNSENLYSDVIQIMRAYEKWIWGIYKKARKINEDYKEDLMELNPGGVARPDQPSAHF